jgi:hypothetical protein
VLPFLSGVPACPGLEVLCCCIPCAVSWACLSVLLQGSRQARCAALATLQQPLYVCAPARVLRPDFAPFGRHSVCVQRTLCAWRRLWRAGFRRSWKLVIACETCCSRAGGAHKGTQQLSRAVAYDAIICAWCLPSPLGFYGHGALSRSACDHLSMLAAYLPQHAVKAACPCRPFCRASGCHSTSPLHWKPTLIPIMLGWLACSGGMNVDELSAAIAAAERHLALADDVAAARALRERWFKRAEAQAS